MDLGFLLGEDNGPRCKGKNRAELFAGEVRAIHDHLALTRPTMWMWGERFLDGDATGIGKWEDSIIGTAPALAMAPKDIVICDWHYDRAPYRLSSSRLPMAQGGRALAQLDAIRRVRTHATEGLAFKMQGVPQPTWIGITPSPACISTSPAPQPAAAPSRQSPASAPYSASFDPRSEASAINKAAVAIVTPSPTHRIPGRNSIRTRCAPSATTTPRSATSTR